MGKQYFIVGKSVLGSRTIPDNRIFPGMEVRRNYSFALFCGKCGEVWGRLLHDAAVYTQVRVVPCLKHGDGRFSLTFPWPEECFNFEDDWPPEAIKHEFFAELAWTLKETK